MYATIEGSSTKGNMNNNSLPELKAFKRAQCLGLSQWENGKLTTNRAQLVLLGPKLTLCQFGLAKFSFQPSNPSEQKP
jgi:hypothetical protein